MAEKGYQKIQQFSWDLNCEQFIECFEKLLEEQR
jgi:hypothetical protein